MKTALITGASRGIGNAIALHLMNEGYRVLGTATSSAGVSKLKEEGIEGLVLDLNSTESKEKLWEQVEKKEIQISILSIQIGYLKKSLQTKYDILNVCIVFTTASITNSTTTTTIQ